MQTRSLPHGLTILYEDRDLLVVDKPSGLLSIATGTEKDRTAHWILSEYLRKRGEKRRVAVVHRLDRETSGVMVFAKSEEIKKKLMGKWNETVEERRYVALAEGSFPESEGTIDAPLGEDSRGKVIVARDGQKAVTRWKVLEEGGGYTLLALELETGRRNQIRAHLDWVNRPIAGDKKYSSASDPIGRLALHAETLRFRHPSTGEEMAFTSPVPREFQKALKH